MANDNISFRSTPRADRTTTNVDASQLINKNQSATGASALDGLFGTSGKASFSKVLDSQVRREPIVADRSSERRESPQNDKLGRPGGKNSPHARAEARANERAADAREVSERTEAAPRKKTESEQTSEVRGNKQKSAAKDDKTKSAESDAPAAGNEQPVVAKEQAATTENAGKEAVVVGGEAEAEGDVIKTDQASAADQDALILAQQRLAMLQIASGTGEGKQSPAAAALSEKLLADSAQKGDGAATAAADAASKTASALAASLTPVDAGGEADPALKELISAMLNARGEIATEGEVQPQASATSANAAQNDAMAALARELNPKTPQAAWMAREMANAESAVVASEEATLDSLAQEVSLTDFAVSEEGVEAATGMPTEGDAAEAAVAEQSPEALLATETTDDGTGLTGSERQAKPATEKPAPVMTALPTAKGAEAADSEGWDILDRMADALPKNMPKETAETLKNVTPQVQTEQQMALVRNELRSLERLVDAGLQGRVARETGKDDKGLEVKTANLARAIENLTGTAKSVELRSPVPMNNAPVAFGRPGFAEQMAEKIMLMTTQKVQSAEIRLDPKELGAVDVKIRVHQDQATVVFSSPNAQVRDALESSIPRLREMFAESGVGLGSVNVNDRGGSSAGGNEQSQGQGGSGGFGAGDEVVEERPQRLPRQPNGLVDYYA